MAALATTTAQIDAAARSRALASLAHDISWDKQSAQVLIDLLRSPAAHAGFTISIVGSVATRGYSTKDLDLLLAPAADVETAEGFDVLYDFITHDLAAQDLGEAEGYQCYRLPDGRIIDLYTGGFWN